jgi:AcrR family transcriptional regulator
MLKSLIFNDPLTIPRTNSSLRPRFPGPGLRHRRNIDTNNCMNLTTRERLLGAATRLFADGGYRGASVRDICNQAGANPGAVSYHFGGKRQLYRAVLRRAAAGLAELAPTGDEASNVEGTTPDAAEAVRRLLRRITEDDAATRLLLRDLADGGALAVEALAPPLRSAFEQLTAGLGEGDTPPGNFRGRLLFLGLAAPLFLLGAAWPVVARALELQPQQRAQLLDELVQSALAAHSGEETF